MAFAMSRLRIHSLGLLSGRNLESVPFLSPSAGLFSVIEPSLSPDICFLPVREELWLSTDRSEDLNVDLEHDEALGTLVRNSSALLAFLGGNDGGGEISASSFFPTLHQIPDMTRRPHLTGVISLVSTPPA